MEKDYEEDVDEGQDSVGLVKVVESSKMIKTMDLGTST